MPCVCSLFPAIVFAGIDSKNSPSDIKHAESATALETPSEIIINDTLYVKKDNTNIRFFVGMEMPIIFYSTENITFDLIGDEITQKYTEFRLNEGFLDGMSLSFGFDLDSMLQLGFNISKSNTTLKIDRAKEETDIGHYSVNADGVFFSTMSVSPFVRLGIGCISAKNDSIDYTTVFFRAGIGVNYKMTENVFSYALMDYTFIPEGDIKDIEASIDGSVFSMSIGVGYKF